MPIDMPAWLSIAKFSQNTRQIACLSRAHRRQVETEREANSVPTGLLADPFRMSILLLRGFPSTSSPAPEHIVLHVRLVRGPPRADDSAALGKLLCRLQLSLALSEWWWSEEYEGLSVSLSNIGSLDACLPIDAANDSLSDNNVGHNGNARVPKAMEAASFTGCDVRDLGATLTTGARWSSLKFLNLSANPLDDNALNRLGKLVLLEHLDLSQCKYITDLGSLRSLTRLVRLNISNCLSLIDSGIEALASLTALEVLHMNNCKLVTSLKPLGTLENLRELLCLYTRVDSDGAQHLGGLTQLHTVSFANCLLLRDVAPALRCAHMLHRLSLNATGATTEILLPLRVHASQLNHVSVSNCRLLNSLVWVPPSVRVVDASHCALRNDGIECCKEFSLLEEIYLSNNEYITHVKPLAYCKALRQVHLAYTGICAVEGFIAWQGALTCLEYVDLEGCPIEEAERQAEVNALLKSTSAKVSVQW